MTFFVGKFSGKESVNFSCVFSELFIIFSVFYLPFSFDTLPTRRSEDRIPVDARFSAPVQTGPGAHPASYILYTGSFPGVKRPGRGVIHPPPFTAEVKERIELYLYSSSGPSWPVIGWISLLYPCFPCWLQCIHTLTYECIYLSFRINIVSTCIYNQHSFIFNCIHIYFPCFNFIWSRLVSGVDKNEIRNFCAPIISERFYQIQKTWSLEWDSISVATFPTVQASTVLIWRYIGWQIELYGRKLPKSTVWQYSVHFQSQWPRGLRRRSATVRLLRLWVRIPTEGMDVCRECCVLSGKESLRRDYHSSKGVLLTVVRPCVWSCEWGGPGPIGGCSAKNRPTQSR